MNAAPVDTKIIQPENSVEEILKNLEGNINVLKAENFKLYIKFSAFILNRSNLIFTEEEKQQLISYRLVVLRSLKLYVRKEVRVLYRTKLYKEFQEI